MMFSFIDGGCAVSGSCVCVCVFVSLCFASVWPLEQSQLCSDASRSAGLYIILLW